MCASLSTNAAKLFGMYPQKGIISEGSHADIVVWDPNYSGVIAAKEQIQKVDYTPYEGFEITGRAEQVFLRGSLVAENGKVVKEKSGNYLHRKASQDII
jgi:dihydropyrimidinase